MPPAEPKALADAIDDLLRHPTRRKAMGKAGREHFEAEFTIDAATTPRRGAPRPPLVHSRRPTGVTAIDAGPLLVASGGHEAAWIACRRRGSWSARSGAAAPVGIDHARSGGAQIVLRTRASLATTVDLQEGWNSVPLPDIADDIVITWRSR